MGPKVAEDELIAWDGWRAAWTGVAGVNLPAWASVNRAEITILVLGLILIGATAWVPFLSGRTKVLLLLLVIAAGILVVLHRLKAA